MAENDDNDVLEESPEEQVTDEDGSELKKKIISKLSTLSKPLMIKIGIAVIILIIAAGRRITS